METTNVQEYKYTGIELTPQIFSELMVLLLDGKQFDRHTAVETVTEYHKKHGGILSNKEYNSVFKKSSADLRENGLRNVVRGVWKLNHTVKETKIITKNNTNTLKITADKVIGRGNSAVYVYYYDVYKRLAHLEGRCLFECKIGRTDTDALQRIFSQSGTCCPELPKVALIIQCENSRLLEATIHNIFKLKNRHILHASGVEWFMTSPEEVEQIYASIAGIQST